MLMLTQFSDPLQHTPQPPPPSLCFMSALNMTCLMSPPFHSKAPQPLMCLCLYMSIPNNMFQTLATTTHMPLCTGPFHFIHSAVNRFTFCLVVNTATASKHALCSIIRSSLYIALCKHPSKHTVYRVKQMRRIRPTFKAELFTFTQGSRSGEQGSHFCWTRWTLFLCLFEWRQQSIAAPQFWQRLRVILTQ